MINRRLLPVINSRLFSGKVIIITGPRQSGKTTLAKAIASGSSIKYKWFNADEPDVRVWFNSPTSTQLKQLFGDSKLIIIDEAQRIPGIGITLKLAVDNFPEIQVVATGSSALDLAGGLSEHLTGRKWEYVLYPLSFPELCDNASVIEETRKLEQRMIYGYYPDIVNNPGNETELLSNLINSYLFKDILSLDQVRKPALLEKILTALAFQIGSEVSNNEIGRLVGADNQTIERYIDLLQKVYVIFTLPSFSRNMRNELKKSKKVYFWDTGIRNGLIRNFNPLPLRNDEGMLWENFIIAERLKHLHYSRKFTNCYFWRTTQQQEVDLIEESNGILRAYEFKWTEKKQRKFPNSFLKAYPDSKTAFISRENFTQFIL
jgi:uncharacterized protein